MSAAIISLADHLARQVPDEAEIRRLHAAIPSAPMYAHPDALPFWQALRKAEADPIEHARLCQAVGLDPTTAMVQGVIHLDYA